MVWIRVKKKSTTELMLSVMQLNSLFLENSRPRRQDPQPLLLFHIRLKDVGLLKLMKPMNLSTRSEENRSSNLDTAFRLEKTPFLQ